MRNWENRKFTRSQSDAIYINFRKIYNQLFLCHQKCRTWTFDSPTQMSICTQFWKEFGKYYNFCSLPDNFHPIVVIFYKLIANTCCRMYGQAGETPWMASQPMYMGDWAHLPSLNEFWTCFMRDNVISLPVELKYYDQEMGHGRVQSSYSPWPSQDNCYGPSQGRLNPLQGIFSIN